MRALPTRLPFAAGAVLLAALALFRLGPQADGLPRVSRATPVYLDAGENLLHRHLGETAVNLRLPMYGVFEALALDHAGPRARAAAVYAVALLQLALVAALGLLLGSPLGALGAAAAYALLRYGAFTEAASLQPFYAVPVTLASAAAVRHARRPTPARAVFAGAAVGASLLCRSALVFLPPLLAAWDWRRSGSAPAGVRRARLFGLLVVPYLFLLPWIGMNAVVARRFVPLEAESRDSNVAMGALGVVTGVYGEWRAPLDETPPADGVALWAARRALARPGRYARACAARLVFVVGRHPALYAAAAAALALSRAFPPFQAAALFAAYFLGIHCLMTVIPIYFIPLLPLLTAAAAAGAGRLLAPPALDEDAPSYRAGVLLLRAAAVPVFAFALFVSVLLVRYATAGSLERLSDPAALDAEVERFPRDPWLRLERAKAALASDPAAAARDLTAAAGLRPGDAAVAGRLAWARWLTGDPGPLLALPPPDGAAYADEFEALKVPAALAARGRAAALAQYRLARDRFVHASGTWREETPEEAEVTLRVHAARDAAFDRFLAEVATRWRTPADAAAVLRGLSALRPDGAALRHARAVSLHAAGRDAEALPLLRALARGGGGAEAWKDLGVCEFSLGRRDDARRDLERALALDPALVSAALSLGYVESAAGRCPAARAAYRRALATDPSGPEAGLLPLVTDALTKLPCRD
ncbi:MAG: tetratricopeptide repeat protein [Elusimicrobia bacterium]|nr:tetratricopeptide repeat protein [Elusimicrobiota bacterium]